MTYKIEKGIEVPKIQREKITKYPFKDMEEGDCIHVDGIRVFLAACAAMRAHSRSRDNYSYATRQDDDRKGGRIWRTVCSEDA